jgi:hypothetical protein
MECSDLRDDMMDVLYGEASSAKAGKLEEHLKTCAGCRDEMAAFRDVRQQLGAWQLPVLVRPVPHTIWGLAAKGLAAAALLLLSLGGGLGLSGSEVRFENGHLSLRLGRSQAEVDGLLAEQQAHLVAQQQGEISNRKASVRTDGGISDDAVLKRVEALIRESDERHAQLLKTSLDAYSRQVETQRRYDLARVSAGLSYLDGKTGQDVARTAQLVGYVLQASEKK